MRTLATLVTVLSMGVLGAAAACSGGGDQGDAGSDSGVGKEAASLDVASDVPVVCTATDSYTSVTHEGTTFIPTPTDAGTDASDDGAAADAATPGGPDDVYLYEGDLNGDPDVLSVQLYAGYGVFTNRIQPGTYQLTGDETNYQTCGLCVQILTDIDPSNGKYTDAYMATGGTVTITALQPTLTGTLSNVTFTHVTIDSSHLSTPVGDCNSSIPSLSIAGPVTQ